MFAGGLKKCAASVSRRREDKQGEGQLYPPAPIPLKDSASKEIGGNPECAGKPGQEILCFRHICRGAGRASVSGYLSTQGTRMGRGGGWSHILYAEGREYWLSWVRLPDRGIR